MTFSDNLRSIFGFERPRRVIVRGVSYSLWYTPTLIHKSKKEISDYYDNLIKCQSELENEILALTQEIERWEPHLKNADRNEAWLTLFTLASAGFTLAAPGAMEIYGLSSMLFGGGGIAFSKAAKGNTPLPALVEERDRLLKAVGRIEVALQLARDEYQTRLQWQ